MLFKSRVAANIRKQEMRLDEWFFSPCEREGDWWMGGTRIARFDSQDVWKPWSPDRNSSFSTTRMIARHEDSSERVNYHRGGINPLATDAWLCPAFRWELALSPFLISTSLFVLLSHSDLRSLRWPSHARCSVFCNSSSHPCRVTEPSIGV